MVNVVGIRQDAMTTTAQFDSREQALAELLAWAGDSFYTERGTKPYVRAFVACNGLLNEYEVVKDQMGWHLVAPNGKTYSRDPETGKLVVCVPGKPGHPDFYAQLPATVRK